MKSGGVLKTNKPIRPCEIVKTDRKEITTITM